MLQPAVAEIPSYLQDTQDFLNKIKTINNIPEETYLATPTISNLEKNYSSKESLEQKLQ